MSPGDRKTVVRFVEALAITFLAALVSEITLTGQPIDFTKADSQRVILTALLTALGVAARRSVATPARQ